MVFQGAPHPDIVWSEAPGAEGVSEGAVFVPGQLYSKPRVLSPYGIISWKVPEVFILLQLGPRARQPAWRGKGVEDSHVARQRLRRASLATPGRPRRVERGPTEGE